MRLNHPSRRGFVLLEALFALALLGAGLLSLLQMMQLGMHTQRQQLAREAAMGLAYDLSQRMQVNATQLGSTSLSLYAQSWGQSTPLSDVDCQQTACTALPPLYERPRLVRLYLVRYQKNNTKLSSFERCTQSNWTLEG